MAKIKIEDLGSSNNVRVVLKYDEMQILKGANTMGYTLHFAKLDHSKCECCGNMYKREYEARSTPAADLWRDRICKPCLQSAIKEWTTLLIKHKLVIALDEHIENKLLAEKLVR